MVTIKAKDFEYDGKNLSDFGFIICNFGSKGLETISNGGQSTFNTVSTLDGKKHRKVSVKYEDCAEDVIQICKTPCYGNVMEISDIEFREMTRWLGRNKFLKFKKLEQAYIDLYFEVRFKISKIEIDGILYGLELEVESNAPFARKEAKIITIKNTTQNGIHSINDTSCEEGHTYPYTEITIGDIDDLPNEEKYLRIYNAREDRETYINGVSTGEVITMDYPIITSSLPSHNIQNDFNYTFFRVANTYENSRNDLTISIPCTIKMKYSPIVKVGL